MNLLTETDYLVCFHPIPQLILEIDIFLTNQEHVHVFALGEQFIQLKVRQSHTYTEARQGLYVESNGFQLKALKVIQSSELCP